jgi:catechol 2,3-dioxygenase-like lactoylglutathione lyase family enzyme
MTRIRRVVPDLGIEEIGPSRDFYTSLLGFDVGMDMGWIVSLVSRDNPTAQINLLARGGGTAGHVPDITVEVDEVDGIHREAERRGYEIVHPITDEDWGVRRFFVRDPGGRVVNVMTHLDR